MSRLVAFAAIQGAYNIVSKVEGKFKEAMDKYGPNQPLEFPNTAYYLPIIYSILGIKVEKLADAEPVLERCKKTVAAAHQGADPYAVSRRHFGCRHGGHLGRRDF